MSNAITPQVPAEVAPYVPQDSLVALMLQRSEALTALEILKARPCETPEHEQFFSDARLRAKLIAEQIEEKRTAITRPLLAAKNGVDDLFTPTRRAWESIADLCKSKIQAAQQARLEAAARAREEAMRLAAEAAPPVQVAQALARVPETSTPQGVSVGAEWVVDSYDFDQIPREWLTIDWSKVKIHCAAHKKSEHIPPVPGLTFKRQATVRGR
jgi:hypothetical protein